MRKHQEITQTVISIFIVLIVNESNIVSVRTLYLHEKAIQVHPVVKVLLCMHNDGLISVLCKSPS